MKLKSFLFFLFFVILQVFGQEEKQILFLSSYNSRYPTYFKQIDGLKEGLNSPYIDIDVEFLDSKRFNDSLSYQLFYQSLANKIGKIGKYDAIVTADDNAFDFSLLYQKELFQNSPIIFLGLNNLEKAYKQDQNPNVTGIVETVALKENIDLMKSLFGESSNFYVISDNTNTGKTLTNQFLKLETTYPDITFELINFGDYSGLKEFSQKLQNIPKRAPILLISALRDASDRWYDFHNSLQIVYQNTESPIFHLWEHGLNYGVLGGKFNPLFDQGKQAGQLLRDVLNGKDITDIKVESNNATKYQFNYNELVKYDIALDQLPKNSTLKNNPKSFFSENYKAIISVTIILASLVSFIVFLLMNIRRREIAEQKLIKQNERILNLNTDLQISKNNIEIERDKFKSIFQNHSIPKLIVNPENGNIFDANTAAATFYKYSISDLKAMNINNLCEEDCFTKIKTLNSSDENVFEFEHQKSDGLTCHVEVIASTIPIQDGKEYIYCVINDISEEKKYQFNSKLFENIVVQSPFSIVITDKKGFIEYANPSFIKTTGYSFNELLGKHTRILKSGKQPKEYYKKLWDSIIQNNIWHGELINKRKNGELYTESKTICPIVNEKGEIEKFIALAEDITEIRKAFADLVETKEALEYSNRLKTEFMQNVSHEIRTPMNGIMGFSDLLMNRKNLSDEKKYKYAETIQRSSRQLLKIIDDILEISKLNTKQVTLHIEQFCLNALFKELHSIFYSQFNSQGLDFKLMIKDIDSPFIIETDRTKLYSILINLLSNALKFTKEGHVSFGYTIFKDKVECFVKDTGIGISESNLKTIFNHFEQEEKEMTQKYDGLGLGLAISKQNAKLLGGDICVVSKKEEGSTFTVKIPFAPVKTNIVRESAEKNIASKAIKKSQKQIKILLAEDEEVNYWFIDSILTDFMNFELLYAYNGERAVDLFEQHPNIDLVLMDLRMPIMDGFTATRIIKSKKPETPIIAVTSFTSEEERIRAFEQGCDDFITKPFKDKELIEVIKKHLR